jgi:hypothetical protein
MLQGFDALSNSVENFFACGALRVCNQIARLPAARCQGVARALADVWSDCYACKHGPPRRLTFGGQHLNAAAAVRALCRGGLVRSCSLCPCDYFLNTIEEQFERLERG